ncbi:C1 family peptidase [Legionella oakridgensis]|uniref:Aminopeptidase C n=2 Tax=Legionella oakridgensis TaxID=29423 RepID=W0BFN8_9GAMM|nr:C1 family peptidase [Legionella oakridgensis]AHE67442.1 aminopeptidase C [Legionella oakridgensis ATCC 33761 = DSM 21215]ETO92973.1 aminopeptidase C [Legionella oakridgensis RV-2-2007]KTD43501.1 cysteine protease [Legionella oakridgensis]STY20493.1 cysteine protease, papain C1 family [Legionella longbeachae]
MKLAKLFVAMTFASGSVFANNIEIIGNIHQPIQSLHAHGDTVTLLKMKLSDKALKVVHNRAQRQYKQHETVVSSSKYPARIQLGMNQVPVLNQGTHGSCVTFANTAAVDAVLGKGDYISQLCQLQLGRYLEYNAYGHSGWNGAYGPDVLNQMTLFGIVNKEQQRMYGCGGLTEYPVIGMDPDTEMSLTDYHNLSEKIPDDEVRWSSILDVDSSTRDRTDTNKTLQEIKKALNAGDRVTFGSLLMDVELGVAGAVGRYHAENDTWVLTTEIARDIYLRDSIAGHEMIITGYDDDAIAFDEEGRQYRGLLTLRNSWGEKRGNHGDFYMSYDYFRTFVLEAQRIRALQPEWIERYKA